MTIAVSDTTGNVAITHTGSTKNVDWTTAGTFGLTTASFTVTSSDDFTLTATDNITIESNSAGGIIAIGNNNDGNVISIGTDDTAADDIDIGSAKDDLDLEGEDITLDTADDGNATVANDWTFTMESASGAFAVQGTAGCVFNLYTDDTTADDINIGSAKDDVDITGVTVGLVGGNSATAITLTTNAGTSEQIVITNTQGTNAAAIDINAAAGGVDIDADLIQIDSTNDMGLQVTSSTAGKDLSIAQVGANDSSILVSAAGTGTDAISLQATAGSIDVDASQDMTIDVGNDITINGGSVGSIIAIGNNDDGNVFNIGTDNTAADDINIGSALDDITLAAEDITLTTADDLDITSTSAGGIISLGGTPGVVLNIGTDNTTADTIGIGSAKDTTTINGTLATATGVGAIVANKATAVEQIPYVHTTVLTFTLTGDHDLDLADGDHGTGIKVYDFPEGRIQILGVTVNASVTANDAFNTDPNDRFYLALGTVTAADDNDLTSTEENLSAKATLDTVGNTTLTLDWHAALAAQAQFDGTTTPVDVFVNVACADTSNTKASTYAITGTATIVWVNLGDY